jgi:hypothetical protein
MTGAIWPLASPNDGYLAARVAGQFGGI